MQSKSEKDFQGGPAIVSLRRFFRRRELRDIGGYFWVCDWNCFSFLCGMDVAQRKEGHRRPFKGLILLRNITNL